MSSSFYDYTGVNMTADLDNDFFKEDAPVLTEEALSVVSHKAQELIDAQEEVEQTEKRLSQAKEKLERIQTVELPEAMDNAQFKEFTLKSGKKIVVKPVVNGSPTKDNRDNAMDWLREHDHDGIIKREVSAFAKFGKGEDSKAEELEAFLRLISTALAEGLEINISGSRIYLPGKPQLSISDAPSVHYQTFGAWARELKEDHDAEHLTGNSDKDCPFCDPEIVKLLGIYVGRKAEVVKTK